MKTNHDGTITLNAYDTWISCTACGKRVKGDSIHTCSPQLKELTDEEIAVIWANHKVPMTGMDFKKVVGAILRKAKEK